MKERVEAALGMIKFVLRREDGDLELVEVTDGVVKIRLTGACQSCPMSGKTSQDIERHLKQQVPEVKAVEFVA